jgi:autotransporter-associated beta strand protein
MVLNTTSTSVSHSYTTAGNKTVSLTVYGTDGSTNMLTQTDYIQVSASASLVWLGDGSANLWNLSAANWTNGFALVPYYDGSDVVFNDTGSIAPAINLTITAQPHSIIFNNTVAKAYTLGGAGKISGTNGLTLQGGGSLTILNTNDYSAETTIVAGTLQLGNGSAMGEVGTNIIVNNAALVLAPPAGSTAFSNSITGSGSVTLNGNATAVLTLLGANTYTSNTVISAGTLKLDPASPLPSGTNNGDLVINGTLDIAAANPVLDAIFGSGVITTTDTGLDGFIVGANGHSGVFNGSIHNGSGTVSLAVTNGATLTLTASSSFSGDVYAANGTVRISANGALGNGPKNIWANGTTAQIALNGTNGNLTLPANYMLLTSHGSPSAALDNLAGNNTVNGPIYLTYGAGGTRIAVDGGTLTLAGAVSVNTNVINDNRVLELSGSGNGTVSGPMTNDPAINGILNVTKTGAGTWTLSNAGNECGYTTVSLGRLLVTGAITNTVAAAVTVTGGALGGTGNLASPVTVTNAGTLEGGDHLNLVYGTLALGSDLNLMRGGACSFRLGATAAGSNDKITVGGNLSVNNTNSVVISAGTLETANDYVLLTVAGTITGSFNTNVTWSGTPPTGSANYSVVTTANQVKLHYTSPAPSPTSITYTASGSSLVLNWPNGQGWRLESQTNSLATGLGTTWVNVTGATSPFTNTVDPANGTVFYRLVYP